MTEYQITSWRELPSMVVARDGAAQSKVQLPQPFQEAIDEAAMRLGDVAADAYLEGWQRSDWTAADGSPDTVASETAARLEAKWPPEAITRFLDGLAELEERR